MHDGLEEKKMGGRTSSWEAGSKVQVRWTQGLKGTASKNSNEGKNGVNITKIDLILCMCVGTWGELKKIIRQCKFGASEK